MNTPTPESPLPWIDDSDHQLDIGSIVTGEIGKGVSGATTNKSVTINLSADDAAYIVAACNTYPQLVADRARLIAALQKTNELVARGHVEGAYNAIAAGPQYAERVMAATASLLRELGEG